MDHPERYKLASLRARPGTLTNYDRDLQEFMNWLPTERHNFSDWGDLDVMVTDFAVHLYNAHGGRRKQVARNVKSALEFYFPEASGLFPFTSRSVEGWNTVTPIEQKAVCPEAVAYGLAHELIRLGKIDCSVAILVAFDWYLRVGQVTGIRTQDLSLEVESGGHCGAITLPRTKTGLNQSVLIRMPILKTLLSRVVARRSLDPTPTESIFNLTTKQINWTFKTACESLGVGYLKLTPHSLRYGGASNDALTRRLAYSDIKARGRWRDDKSLQRYLQPGLILAQLNRVPRGTRNTFARLVDDPYTYFNVPRPEEDTR